MAKTERKKGRVGRVVGYVLAGFGILSIVDFFSPIPVPTVGLSAFISGGILVAAGLYFIYLRDVDWKSFLRRVISRKEPERVEKPAAPVDPHVPVEILKLARERGGVLTVTTVAMELDVPLPVAEAGLEECVQRGVATPEYDDARRAVTYRFPEFLPPPERRELP